tara:strand:+ start:349 stop:2019 length:1671 start_codon:yes stop_codon:yes gene_type:complete
MKYYKVKSWSLFIVISCSFTLFSGLFLKNVYELQFTNSEYFQEQALSYRVKSETLKAKRGSIYDKNLNPIATSTQAFNIGIFPDKISDIKEASILLSPLLHKDSDEIAAKIIKSPRFFYLDRNIEYKKGEEIKSWNLGGILIEPSSKRIIHEPSIKKIIGVVDTDSNGIEGLELYFNSTLEGQDGIISYEAAPNGSIIPQANIQTTQPIHGEDLILTLDSELQYLANNLCKEALLNTNAFNCSVVFANANTGEVLISAEERGEKDFLNIDLISSRAQYEPGSSFKIFSIGLALEEDLINENTEFYVRDEIELIENSCQKDFIGYKGCYRDFLEHEPYTLSVKEIIERSSNVGTIMATADLDILVLENYLEQYGFTKKTGIELSGESKGSFDPYKKCTTCLSSLSIGYSVNVTQMQMVKAYSIIANGGKDIDLTIIKSPYVNKTQSQIIDLETSDRLRKLLINVVEGEDGTGRSLRMDNYKIGGKTGTSRTHIEGVGYSDYRFNTSFTGFIDTAEGPIVGSVILWGASVSPYTEYVTGGSTAAPIFKTIVSYLLPGD